MRDLFKIRVKKGLEYVRELFKTFFRRDVSFFFRFLTFLKLFLGMGIVWTFEIVAGFLGVDLLEQDEEKW